MTLNINITFIWRLQTCWYHWWNNWDDPPTDALHLFFTDVAAQHWTQQQKAYGSVLKHVELEQGAEVFEHVELAVFLQGCQYSPLGSMGLVYLPNHLPWNPTIHVCKDIPYMDLVGYGMSSAYWRFVVFHRPWFFTEDLIKPRGFFKEKFTVRIPTPSLDKKHHTRSFEISVWSMVELWAKDLQPEISEISEAYSTYVYIIIHISAYFWCQGSCHVHTAKPVLLNSTLVGTRFFFHQMFQFFFPQKAWKSCCPKTKLSF